jgi:hypothetical protein
MTIDATEEREAGQSIVAPVSPLPASGARIAPPLQVRPGLRIALLSNGKVNGSELLEAVANSLSASLRDVEFVHYRKPSVSVPPTKQDFDEIVTTADAAICAIGDCGSCSSRTMRDAIELEHAGIPSVAIIADALVSPVNFMREMSGVPDYPYCITPFPVGNLTPEETAQRGETLAPEVLLLLTRSDREGGSTAGGVSSQVSSAQPPKRAGDETVPREWTDGLPVIRPTTDRVDAFLTAVARAADDVVCTISTRNSIEISAGVIAANAVMAGCLPEHMPVVLAAVEALGDPRCNLHAHTATLSGAQQVVIVNGPIRARLGINSGEGAFGPGPWANASIGRAVRLVVRNAARSIHGEFDRSTFSHPGRFTWCFGEADDKSPWTPLASVNGLPRGTDAVSIYATVWQASVICHSPSSEVLLDEIALATRTACHVNWLHSEVASDNSFFPGRPFLFVVGTQHADVLVRDGYTTRERIGEELFARLTRPDDRLRPVSVFEPANIHVVYLDASGFQQTQFFAPFQSHELVTRPVETGPSQPAADPLVEARLSSVRQMLNADGFRLDHDASGSTLHLRVSADDASCADCLVPRSVFEQLVRDALRGTVLEGHHLQVTMPAAAASDR